MKKILLSLVLFLGLPLITNASEVSVTDFLVDAYIKENGDLEVNELIVADGTFNWYERDLVYANSNLRDTGNFENNSIYNADDITNVVIKAKNVKNVDFTTFSDSDFNTFIEDDFASNGSVAKYTTSRIYNGYRYRTYYYTNNSRTAFLISYTVNNAVVVHNDVAELYWTFIPDGFEEDLHNIKIKVHLPAVDNSDNFRIWAHGNLSGEVKKENNATIYAYIDEVFPGEAVDIRTTFDKSLVPTSLKSSYRTALEGIIEVETERADVANDLRAELLAKYNFVKYTTLIMYGAIIILGIFIFFKYGKSPKSTYYSKYNREFIDDYNVEVIDYLMNRKITPNAMSASIMNLIYKKNIKAIDITSVEKVKKKEYKFILENTDNLNESENILIEFLFDRVGKNTVNAENKKEFTTTDLKNYAKGSNTCNTFISSYTKWKNNVLSKGKAEKFYESNAIPKLIGIIVLVLVFFLFMFAINEGVDYVLTYILLIVTIIFFIYALVIERKTIKGIEHYTRWKAFKNFLDDFGTFELKELPEIILWERYLVYATIFGLADKVQKTMNVKIKEMEVSNLNYDYTPSFFYINVGSTINSSVNSAINSAYSRQAANYRNSHSSSSSGGGFGGGFSSGGGFGGGGGGGRFG